MLTRYEEQFYKGFEVFVREVQGINKALKTIAADTSDLCDKAGRIARALEGGEEQKGLTDLAGCLATIEDAVQRVAEVTEGH